MRKRLTRTGNSLALVLVRTTARTRRFKSAAAEINAKYAGVFKRLAE